MKEGPEGPPFLWASPLECGVLLLGFPEDPIDLGDLI